MIHFFCASCLPFSPFSFSLMPGITIGRGFGKDPTLSLGGSLQYVGRPKLRVASADLQKVCNKWFQVDVNGNRLPDQRCACEQ